MLIIYFGIAISVVKLRYSQKAQSDEFKIPGGLLVPILAMGIIIYFLSNLGKVEAIAAGISIGILSLIYVLIKVYKNKLK